MWVVLVNFGQFLLEEHDIYFLNYLPLDITYQDEKTGYHTLKLFGIT